MENELLIPNDKIYIIPTNQETSVKIVFENGSSIMTADYSDSHHTIQFDKWADYNTMVISGTLQEFIEDYVSKNFPEEHTVSIYNECVCESLL